jgi:hypothetical protein
MIFVLGDSEMGFFVERIGREWDLTANGIFTR